MNLIKHLIFALFGAIILQGCDQSLYNEPAFPNDSRTLYVRLQPEGLTVASASERSEASPDDIDASSIESVVGYRFSQGIFQEAVAGEQLHTDGTYTFYLKELSGDIYFIANGNTELFAGLQAGVSSLEEFLESHLPTDSMTRQRFLMTGRMTLDGEHSSASTIRMRRSVARLDLATSERDVKVRRVTIRGIADRGYINERTQPGTPAGAERGEFQKEYLDTPLENNREMLLYLCEQESDMLTAEVIAEFGEGLHRMTTTFPAQLLRNRIYTLQVHGKGADAYLTITAGDWEEGPAAEAEPDLKGLIQMESSTLPDNVRVNASLDSVFVSYHGGEFRLALCAETGSEVEIEGAVGGVTTSIAPLTKTLHPIAEVSVNSRRRMPNEHQEYLYLNVRRDNVYSGRIVLVFEPNPVRISGQIELNENGICDFERYIDGELGRISLPEGKTARLEFASGEDPWMQLSEDDQEMRLLGGWKPNDPKADGRVQEGRLVISDIDGSHAESYLIRRRNWGLPVVQIGNTWWCKYNLRGNVRSFQDQISIQADPADDQHLADYLSSCNEAELLRLMGDQYQGGNPQGLPLRHDGTAFFHEGMRSSGQNFGTADPTQMAPDGYQIPDYDDYSFFSGSNNYNLGGVGSRNYRNAAGQELSIRIIERDATLLGQNYGIVSFYEFRFGTACWVLYGLGHQWDTTPGNIARMMLLLATYGHSANSWVMEGYAQGDRPNQNWLKFTNQNSTKTRTIRCIKTPVEYIYN